MDPAIAVRNVSVRYLLPGERLHSIKEFTLRSLMKRTEYRELWALKDVSFDVGAGETFGIVGRNGAGKSSLLKVIARVMKPAHGEAIVAGRVIPLIELGTGFDMELTARENVSLNGSIFGFSRKQMAERLDRIVDFAELRPFIEAPLRTFSAGMVARLAFAIATHLDPDILILDEILGVGDSGFQRKCHARIEEFRRQGVAILMVSHNVADVRAMCDRVIWLERGRTKQLGDTDHVTRDYENFLQKNGRLELSAQGEAL
jgi:homopolymeric O-antigen transport system ATP-binding protein